MKYKPLLPFLFCTVMLIQSKAQDKVLTSDEMLPYGSMMDFKFADSFGAIDTTIQDIGVVWDFADIPTSGSFSIEIVNPADTPYGAQFPTANYAYLESPQTAYRYFALDEMKMERVGSWFGGVINTYTDSQIEYVFPLELGASSYDTWDNTNSSFGGTYSLKCLGDGTLILPNGTYDNTLFVRVHVEEFIEYDAYFWYSADNGAILLEYFIGDGFFTSSFALVLDELTTTVSTDDRSFVEHLFYNNPVTDLLNVELSSRSTEPISYQLLDLNGRCLVADRFSNTGTNRLQLQLDMSAYHPGMYFLQLSSEQG
ncbi:MAG: T9SS type A sorting domain-containing protein, partial [Phaeodactylibacter sp.]|nr:T9SS type A sorting domain-containing protein [Phaeodactylibacter sp.]